MTYKFKDTEEQVEIRSEYNTRIIYLTDDEYIDRGRTIRAYMKYSLCQRTAGLRAAWHDTKLWLKWFMAGGALINIVTRLQAWLHRRTAPVRHYVGLTRAIKRYKVV